MIVASSRSRLEGSVPSILTSVFDETKIMADTAVDHKIFKINICDGRHKSS